jgi:hypothetical protein
LETLAHRMNTSRVVALSSAVAFATQVVFALLMLRWFSPQEVGEFSVISQIGFFWMTLALAQSQLSVLANQHLSAHTAAQNAWRTSVLRGLALLPIAALAVWFSQLAMWPTLLWAMLLAVCQMGWMLAQSFTLRAGSAAQQAAVRMLPPITAAAVALTAAMMGAALGWHGPSLVLSALLGYAVGALWLAPALRARATPAVTHHETQTQADPRSAALRMAHTLVDALLATAILVVWQRLYGAQETGWMSALLRVLGFAPAVVHVAWAQVVLAKGLQPDRATPWWVGIGAFACVIALGLACALALDQGWLDPRWDGVWQYIAPLVLWQGSACLSAALSYRPFQAGYANQFSLICILLCTIQSFVLFAPIFSWGLGEVSTIGEPDHFIYFSFINAISLIGLTLWQASLKPKGQL